ncbi:MAG: VOC family protein [Candidatus Nitrosocosmicus sp.]|nr:VOC family protein [Candidatus Nitrosocosmicus sp.]
MPTVQHFEIPADDVERAIKFYKGVFDWTMQKLSNSEDSSKDYWFFETKDENGNKGIGGGLMKRQSPEHSVTNYITVPSVDDYASRIVKAGGKVIMPKTEIPDMGFIIVFLDTENNMFGLYEAIKK